MWYIHIIIPIILAIILNYYIYIQKWNNNNNNNKLPPGYIIGFIWIVILGLLGYIHFLLSVISFTISSNDIPFASARVFTKPSTISVVVTPGQIEFTVISCLANC